MAPPPVPWFRGRTVTVVPSQDAISIRALGGHAFTSPNRTREITLPTAMLVLAIAEGAALGFRGIFTSVELPIDIVVAPVDPEDAQHIERVLNEQLSLPRIPTRIAISDLARCENGAFVRVEGTYRRGRLDDVRLEASNLQDGKRYRVFGFYRDGRLVAVEETPL